MIKLVPKLAKRLTKEQLSVLRKSVKEKREIPIRVVYTQKYWDQVAQDFSYSLATRELAALRNSIAKVASVLGDRKVNVIHLGVGNGVETPILIDALKMKNIDTYSIVDVNKTMLNISAAKMKKQYPKLKVKRFCCDIETYGIKEICQETKKSGAAINLIVLIANGVLFSNDDFVKEIVKNMGPNDFFLLSLELYQKGKEKEIIAPYMIPSVLDLLANGIKILGHEVKYEYFDAEIDKKKNWLKVYFSPAGERAEKLLVLRSYKPNVTQLTARMNKFGLKTVQINEYKKIHTSVVLYKRK